MQFLFYAPKLTTPTQDSLRDYSLKRFKKLERFFPRFRPEHSIRISAEKEKNDFILRVEIPVPVPIYIEVSHPNLYAAIDQAYDVVKRSVKREKEKKRRR